MVSLQLDPDLERRLGELAAQRGRSTDQYVADVLLDHLEDEDDRRVAEERLRNPGRIYSMEEAERELGVDRRVD